MIGTLPWIRSSLMYASGYPTFDYEEPERQAERMPEPWHVAVFRQNTLEFCRWPPADNRIATPARL